MFKITTWWKWLKLKTDFYVAICQKNLEKCKTLGGKPNSKVTFSFFVYCTSHVPKDSTMYQQVKSVRNLVSRSSSGIPQTWSLSKDWYCKMTQVFPQYESFMSELTCCQHVFDIANYEWNYWHLLKLPLRISILPTFISWKCKSIAPPGTRGGKWHCFLIAIARINSFFNEEISFKIQNLEYGTEFDFWSVSSQSSEQAWPSFYFSLHTILSKIPQSMHHHHHVVFLLTLYITWYLFLKGWNLWWKGTNPRQAYKMPLWHAFNMTWNQNRSQCICNVI